MAEIICIVCPKGCHLSVDEKTLSVTGNGCPRGAEYGKNELTSPVRMVTSTVKIEGSFIPRCPVKTSSSIPKACVEEAVRLLDGLVVQAPVELGQVIVKDICGTGIDFIATRALPAQE